ncbi:CRISPR-associated endonuclease Cas1 [Niveibacterium sp. COAC-50]|uniref:CRISPR-associated endonuclease Cas1 n=1 Tax=Niveibacterium sp. COAC-50 TaxID=2729384 RepID=UPI00155733F8|nr:CRISPR-associated endonuclease Cas1 [Niveibacterium sp. COAC-50]
MQTTTLLQRTLQEDILLAAWQRVQDNDGVAGCDGVTIDAFARNAMSRIQQLADEVRNGAYRSQPLRPIELPRPGRAPRLLAVPTVRDRLLQTAATLALTPELEPHFEDESFAYRPGRCVPQAIERVIRGRERGNQWVVDADIHSYFDNIPHAELLERLCALVPDDSLLTLIINWIQAPLQQPHGLVARACGIPQGGPISPLLANLYLDDFDETIARPGRWLVRYADDFVILCANCEDAELALEQTDQWLAAAGLELNFDKTRITTFAQGFSFLGVCFQDDQVWAADPAAAPWLLPRWLRPAAGALSTPERAVPPGARRVKAAHAPQFGNGEASEIVQPSPVRPRAATTPSEALPDALRQADIPEPDHGELVEDYGAPPLLRTVHVAEDGAYLHKRGGRLIISRGDEDLLEVPLEKIDQISVAGEGAVSFAALRELTARRVGFVVQGAPGEPLIGFSDLLGGTVDLQRRQFLRHQNPVFNLDLARSIVAGKIGNSRLVLRRYYRLRGGLDPRLDEALAQALRQAKQADSLDAVRGHEGTAAKRYFEALAKLFGESWHFNGRQRQPPRDPINAMLSYGYAILYQNMVTLIARRGLNPHVGALHALRPGHAALASDLMEEFRSLVVDSTVLRLVLRDRITRADFRLENGLPRLDSRARRIFIAAIEDKLDSPLTHPRDGAPTDFRRAMQSQVTQWADLLLGRTQRYEPFTPH